jgi:hypothetical protein
MTTSPPRFIRGHVRISIVLHRHMHGQAPRQILVGLTEMVALEKIEGRRLPGSSLAIRRCSSPCRQPRGPVLLRRLKTAPPSPQDRR